MGIPFINKTLSKEVWELIINKLQDKIKEWTCRSLNLVGCLVLTQAILQAIPMFIFSTLPAPKGIKQQIRSIQREFLWGRGEEKNKRALVVWDKIYKTKSHGGLGIHDPKTINRVSGAKLWWRWIKESKTPWSKLWKQKYSKNWQDKDHIIMLRYIKGSHIWNLSWEIEVLFSNIVSRIFELGT